MRLVPLTCTVVAAAAVAVSAQMASPQCQSAVVTAFSSPDAACLNPIGLAPLGNAQPDTPIVPILDKWLTGLCAAAPCTNSSLAKVVSTIFQGCQVEFAPANITVDQAVTFVQGIYPAVRKALCLKNNVSGQLCFTEGLKNIESVSGPLTISNAGTIISGLFNGKTVLPTSAVCSDCNKETLNIFRKQNPDLIPPDILDKISQKCGPSFVDGQTPPTVTR